MVSHEIVHLSGFIIGKISSENGMNHVFEQCSGVRRIFHKRCHLLKWEKKYESYFFLKKKKRKATNKTQFMYIVIIFPTKIK